MRRSLMMMMMKSKVSPVPLLSEDHSMEAYRGLEVWPHTLLLTSALYGGEWSASRPGRFNPRGGAPGTHFIGGWVGPRAGVGEKP